MKISIYKALASVFVSSVVFCGTWANANPNLVANGSFETGDFTGWTLVTPDSDSYTWVGGASYYPPEDGNYAAFFGAVGSDGTISQTLTTIPGQTYDLTGWYENDGLTPNNGGVLWDGVILGGFTNESSHPWEEFYFSVTGTGSDSLEFFGRDDPGWWGLDNVSVSVPEPTSVALTALGLLAIVAARRKSKQQ